MKDNKKLKKTNRTKDRIKHTLEKLVNYGPLPLGWKKLSEISSSQYPQWIHDLVFDPHNANWYNENRDFVEWSYTHDVAGIEATGKGVNCRIYPISYIPHGKARYCKDSEEIRFYVAKLYGSNMIDNKKVITENEWPKLKRKFRSKYKYCSEWEGYEWVKGATQKIWRDSKGEKISNIKHFPPDSYGGGWMSEALQIARNDMFAQKYQFKGTEG